MLSGTPDDQPAFTPEKFDLLFVAFTRAIIRRAKPLLRDRLRKRRHRIIPEEFLPAPFSHGARLSLVHQIANFPETNALLQAHLETGRYVSPPGWKAFGSDKGSGVQYRVLECLVEPVLTTIQFYGLRPTAAQIVKEYRAYLDTWINGMCSYYAISPVYSLASVDYVNIPQIDSWLKLVLLNKRDVKLFPAINEPRLLPIRHMSEPWIQLVGDNVTTKDSDADLSTFMDEVQRVVWALRLVKSGEVAAPYVFATAFGASINRGHQFLINNKHQDIFSKGVDVHSSAKAGVYLLDQSSIVDINQVLMDLRLL